MKLLNNFALCILLSIFSNTINAQQSYLGLKEVAIEVANQRKILALNAGFTAETQALETQITTMETTTFTAPITPVNAIGFNPVPTDIATNHHVEWAEFSKDAESRAKLESMIARLESLTTRLKNAKILHDYDNYHAALADYAYTNFMAGTGTVGYETKMNDLKQFFGRTPSASKNAASEND